MGAVELMGVRGFSEGVATSVCQPKLHGAREWSQTAASCERGREARDDTGGEAQGRLE